MALHNEESINTEMYILDMQAVVKDVGSVEENQ